MTRTVRIERFCRLESPGVPETRGSPGTGPQTGKRGGRKPWPHSAFKGAAGPAGIEALDLASLAGDLAPDCFEEKLGDHLARQVFHFNGRVVVENALAILAAQNRVAVLE